MNFVQIYQSHIELFHIPKNIFKLLKEVRFFPSDEKCTYFHHIVLQYKLKRKNPAHEASDSISTVQEIII